MPAGIGAGEANGCCKLAIGGGEAIGRLVLLGVCTGLNLPGKLSTLLVRSHKEKCFGRLDWDSCPSAHKCCCCPLVSMLAPACLPSVIPDARGVPVLRTIAIVNAAFIMPEIVSDLQDQPKQTSTLHSDEQKKSVRKLTCKAL